MTVLVASCWLAAVLALLPAVMTAVNLSLFRAPPQPGAPQMVSVIVPARNEADRIGACIDAVLASTDATLEVIVVDDCSTDDTAAVVRKLADKDPRVQLCFAPPLPQGWSGKQHACWSGALRARHPVLLFLDADVWLAPKAVAAMAGFLKNSGSALVSGFPREQTGTLGETLLIPLIHVVLLGYLPLWAMRRSRTPGLGAGCGQVMMADAGVYRRVGGHAVIRASWHDGLALPRAFRRRGEATDIFDASGIACCRMYRGFAETWRGLSKNAHEGMATARALPVWTLLLGGGLVLPFLLLPIGWFCMPGSASVLVLTISAALLTLARVAVALRARQTLLSVALLPAGIAVLLAVQWAVLLRWNGSAPRIWRGRVQSSA